MRIVFMGTPDFAVPTMKAIHQSQHQLVAVIAQPDRPSGRGRELRPPPVKQYAMEQGLPVHQPEKASAPEFVEVVRELEPDLIVVAAYGQILRERFLSIPKYFCMNIHASLLPKYRGAAPINWAIINGDEESGVTTMKMDKGMDTGDMCLKRVIPIGPRTTAEDLHDALSEAGGPLALETIEKLEKGALELIPQNEDEATYAPKLKKEDGLIDWEKDNCSLDRLVRGLKPWPGVFTYLGQKRLRILEAETSEGQPEDHPGRIARISDYGIEVGTGQGRLIIRELQPEGKKSMSVQSFLRGHPVQPGDLFSVNPELTTSDH